MSLSGKIFKVKCLSFGRISILLSVFVGPFCHCYEVTKAEREGISLSHLNPFIVENIRGPATYKPSEEALIVPVRRKVAFANILVEDDAGVLASVRHDIKRWSIEEEYAKTWNLSSTGMYKTVATERKKAYLNKKLLKYLDKRLSGEIKAAEEGSTLKKIDTARKALKPNTNVNISKSVKIKIKARVLQGKAFVIVKNPIAEYETQIKATGEVNMNLKRDLKSIGVKSNINYNMNAGRWVASFDKPLTKKVTTRLSAHQSDQDMAFSSASDKRLEFFFNHAF